VIRIVVKAATGVAIVVGACLSLSILTASTASADVLARSTGGSSDTNVAMPAGTFGADMFDPHCPGMFDPH